MREGLGFGEDPRWHEGRLWYSDFYRHGIYSMAEDGSDELLEHVVPTQPSGLGWLPDGDLLCVSMTDQKVLRFHGDQCATFADISDYCGFWANDMVVVASGVSATSATSASTSTHDWSSASSVSSPSRRPPPIWSCSTPDGDDPPSRARHGLSQRHGHHPRRRDAHRRRDLGVEADAPLTSRADGTLVNRRVWAPLDRVRDRRHVPRRRGADLARQRHRSRSACACEKAARSPGPSRVRSIAFACMLGGEDRRTLYVMTAPIERPIRDRRQDRGPHRGGAGRRRRRHAGTAVGQPSLVSALRRLRIA